MQVKIFTYLFRLIIATPNDFNETQPTKPTNLNLVARNLEISRRCSSLTELEVESSSRTRVRNQKLNELVITKLLFFSFENDLKDLIWQIARKQQSNANSMDTIESNFGTGK